MDTKNDMTFTVVEWSTHAKGLATAFTSNTQIAAAFTNMSDQANKLGIGASDLFVASYQEYQVIVYTCISLSILMLDLLVVKDLITCMSHGL